jgi:hypothetical protein
MQFLLLFCLLLILHVRCNCYNYAAWRCNKSTYQPEVRLGTKSESDLGFLLHLQLALQPRPSTQVPQRLESIFQISLPPPYADVCDVHRLSPAPPPQIIPPNGKRLRYHAAEPSIQNLLQPVRLSHRPLSGYLPPPLDLCIEFDFLQPVLVFILTAKDLGTRPFLGAKTTQKSTP